VTPFYSKDGSENRFLPIFFAGKTGNFKARPTPSPLSKILNSRHLLTEIIFSTKYSNIPAVPWFRKKDDP
jgi:hypothetical protein